MAAYPGKELGVIGRVGDLEWHFGGHTRSGCMVPHFEGDARFVTAEVSEAQFHGEIHALKVVPTSNPTSVCADSEAEEREVDELKVEDREVEPPGLPKACSEATGRLPEYGRP